MSGRRPRQTARKSGARMTTPYSKPRKPETGEEKRKKIEARIAELKLPDHDYKTASVPGCDACGDEMCDGERYIESDEIVNESGATGQYCLECWENQLQIYRSNLPPEKKAEVAMLSQQLKELPDADEEEESDKGRSGKRDDSSSGGTGGGITVS